MRRWIWVFLCTIILFLLDVNTTMAAAFLEDQENSNEGSEDYVPGEVLILYQNDSSSADTLQLFENEGESQLEVLSENESASVALVELEENMTVEEAVEEYRKEPGILAVMPNYILQLYEEVSANDKNLYLQTYLSQVKAEAAWEYIAQRNHEKVRIAVLDTGADFTHPDLENIVNQNLSKEILSTDGTMGDLKGDDYIEGQPGNGTGHGTHICGVLAAEANNMQGIAGVASCGDNSVVELIVVDIFSKEKTTNMSYLIRGMEYAKEQGAKVINLSLGISKSKVKDDTILRTICDEMYGNDITIVCAAGNEGICDEGEIQTIPCDYDTVIGVVSVDVNNKRSYFSNYGDRKDIAAPGSSIYSTLKDGMYGYKSGTSMAVPVVSATAAMMYSVKDDITPYMIQSIIKETGIKTSSDDISDISVINCEEAVKAAGDLVTLPFQDVAENNWCYRDIAYVYSRGIMTGLDDEHFGPAQDLVRAQFALVLYRLSGEKVADGFDTLVFPDVGGGLWYSDAIRWASGAGIVTGYTDTGLFGPSDPITREQIIVMMYRYAEYMDFDTDIEGDINKFEDAEQIDDFAEEAMKWAVGKGIIEGREGKFLAPLGKANRAECAAIIKRFCDIVGK